MCVNSTSFVILYGRQRDKDTHGILGRTDGVWPAGRPAHHAAVWCRCMVHEGPQTQPTHGSAGVPATQGHSHLSINSVRVAKGGPNPHLATTEKSTPGGRAKMEKHHGDSSEYLPGLREGRSFSVTNKH